MYYLRILLLYIQGDVVICLPFLILFLIYRKIKRRNIIPLKKIFLYYFITIVLWQSLCVFINYFYEKKCYIEFTNKVIEAPILNKDVKYTYTKSLPENVNVYFDSVDPNELYERINGYSQKREEHKCYDQKSVEAHNRPEYVIMCHCHDFYCHTKLRPFESLLPPLLRTDEREYVLNIYIDTKNKIANAKFVYEDF